MPGQTMEADIGNMVSRLMEIAGEFTFNTYAKDKLFILSEIKNDHPSSKIVYEENEGKIPQLLSAQVRTLLIMFDDLYDINLYIHKTTSLSTIIDIRYYCKSSLDPAYRKTVIHNSPILHCKIPLPPDYKEGVKFDIHWPNG
jgi:hypothetical protein